MDVDTQVDTAMFPRTDPWVALTAELDAWATAGQCATFWWRDDDATRCGDRLARLLDVAGTTPLTFAVIPEPARDELAGAFEDRTAAGARISVVQHGYRHFNHAPASGKSAEFGPHRPIDTMIAELWRGRETLSAMFGGRFLPVLTPPWNRIAPALVLRLCEVRLVGLSAFGPRSVGSASNVVNTHIDIIDWRGSRGFAGVELVLGATVAHLQARRTGQADAAEPTGLLTHHREHDAACWRFLNRLVSTVERHAASLWVDGFDREGQARQ